MRAMQFAGMARSYEMEPNRVARRVENREADGRPAFPPGWHVEAKGGQASRCPPYKLAQRTNTCRPDNPMSPPGSLMLPVRFRLSASYTAMSL
ncbi:hypothetical protein D3C78_1409520 [compost metagenome]